MGYKLQVPRFELGQIYATSGAMLLEIDFRPYILRHAMGDWGDLGDEDKQTNEEALALGDRIFSAYQINEKVRIYIITECDRSMTTILLASEY